LTPPSLHDALPICGKSSAEQPRPGILLPTGGIHGCADPVLQVVGQLLARYAQGFDAALRIRRESRDANAKMLLGDDLLTLIINQRRSGFYDAGTQVGLCEALAEIIEVQLQACIGSSWIIGSDHGLPAATCSKCVLNNGFQQ